MPPVMWVALAIGGTVIAEGSRRMKKSRSELAKQEAMLREEEEEELREKGEEELRREPAKQEGILREKGEEELREWVVKIMMEPEELRGWKVNTKEALTLADRRILKLLAEGGYDRAWAVLVDRIDARLADVRCSSPPLCWEKEAYREWEVNANEALRLVQADIDILELLAEEEYEKARVVLEDRIEARLADMHSSPPSLPSSSPPPPPST